MNDRFVKRLATQTELIDGQTPVSFRAFCAQPNLYAFYRYGRVEDLVWAAAIIAPNTAFVLFREMIEKADIDLSPVYMPEFSGLVNDMSTTNLSLVSACMKSWALHRWAQSLSPLINAQQMYQQASLPTTNTAQCLYVATYALTSLVSNLRPILTKHFSYQTIVDFFIP